MKKNILLFAIISVLVSAVPAFCAPAEPPPEIAAGTSQTDAQSWSGDKVTQYWPSSSSASGYTLYRGTMAELANLLNDSSDSCARYTGAAASADLTDDDPSTVEGRFFWYIVTGYNSYGEGAAGSATACSRMLDPGSSCGSSYCGDGYCDGNEGAWCPDCPPYCGDGICDPGEECIGCPDCPPCCGDLICDPSEIGNCSDCGPYCGDSYCDPGEEGWCADCPSPPFCGDGICDPGEEGNCSDCGPYCGDGICDGGEEGWCVDCPPERLRH
jgi:hypothetical protein